MINKWNTTEIQNYSNDFSKIICEEFFNEKEAISGAEILNLTEIKQLNLFILKELFNKWHTEMAMVKSPYFDFENTDVKKALEDFMNVLSRSIKIDKGTFEPLLSLATSNTIELYINPIQYFNGQLRNLPDFKLDQEWLKSNCKFFKSYNWLLVELLERLNGMSYVFSNEAIDWVNDILSTDKIEDHSKDLKDFEAILGFMPYLKTEILPEVKTVESKKSFFDEIEMDQKTKDDKISIIENALKAIENKRIMQPDNTYVKETVLEMPIIETRNIEPINILADNNSFKNIEIITNNKVEESTLNEVHAKNNKAEASSLSDFHAKRKIDTIKGNISLNQKFLFTNNLFGGNEKVFNEAIGELEVCNSFSQAKDQMLKKYLPNYNWDLNSPEAEEFFDLLKRRYN